MHRCGELPHPNHAPFPSISRTVTSVSIRNRYLLVSDALLLASVPLLGYLLRFEGPRWEPADAEALRLYTAIIVPSKLLLFYIGGMYNRLWRQATISDLVAIVRAASAAAVIAFLVGAILLPASGLTELRVPLSVVALDASATLFVVAGLRLLAKILSTPARPLRRATDPAALIAGAGSAAEVIAKELLGNPQLGLRLIGFVDDDPAKRSLRLCGLPVLGSLRELPAIIAQHRVAELIIAMPEADGRTVRSVVRAATQVGVRTKIVPGAAEILSDQVKVSALRNVEIQDLLRREPVRTDLAPVRAVIAKRTVLITGAGGSIGSELCRQIAPLAPSRMVLLGHGENSIFEVRASLREAFPDLETIPVIGDVRDAGRIEEIVSAYRPRAIFHAAAHKHVPLMEVNVGEAILNNVLGTRNVIDAAINAGTDHLVFISTDKAVRPCSVMGLTKRVAEQAVQAAALRHARNFVAVRFGNVLGSRGSVVPAFLQQIRAGGPVLVTHPEMRRFFMTIPEAVQLVLQAAALGRQGDVFVLEMGEAVRIVDLARDLIRLSGLDPDADIELRFTGLRPGERLDEEVLISGEHVAATEHPKVLRATSVQLPAGIEDGISDLIAAAQMRLPEPVLRTMLSALVPEATLPPAAPLDELVPAAAHTNGHDRTNGAGHHAEPLAGGPPHAGPKARDRDRRQGGAARHT
jgi:FlaA1/EpsC-like NDP-sugar epimerase